MILKKRDVREIWVSGLQISEAGLEIRLQVGQRFFDVDSRKAEREEFKKGDPRRVLEVGLRV